MKKVLSVSMIVALLFTFSACSSKEYIDIPVTDENGQVVTDENGETVTQRVEGESTSANGGDAEDDSDTSTGTTAAQDSDGSGNSSGASNRNVSNANSSGGSNSSGNSSNSGNAQNTTAKQTTTEKTTTAAPKRRDIDVTVVLPYYNNQKTQLTVYYRVAGDKEYTELETREVELDEYGKKETFEIKNVKGVVAVTVAFEGITIRNNAERVEANETSVRIEPVTGIEIMDGGME